MFSLFDFCFYKRKRNFFESFDFDGSWQAKFSLTSKTFNFQHVSNMRPFWRGVHVHRKGSPGRHKQAYLEARAKKTHQSSSTSCQVKYLINPKVTWIMAGRLPWQAFIFTSVDSGQSCLMKRIRIGPNHSSTMWLYQFLFWLVWVLLLSILLLFCLTHSSGIYLG